MISVVTETPVIVREHTTTTSVPASPNSLSVPSACCARVHLYTHSHSLVETHRIVHSPRSTLGKQSQGPPLFLEQAFLKGCSYSGKLGRGGLIGSPCNSPVQRGLVAMSLINTGTQRHCPVDPHPRLALGCGAYPSLIHRKAGTASQSSSVSNKPHCSRLTLV